MRKGGVLQRNALGQAGFLLLCGVFLSACGGSKKDEPQLYTVSASSGSGGGISPASRSVQSGQTTTFTVTPDTGYSITSVTGCNGSLSGNTYTTGTVTSACSVQASFSLNSYSVTATAGEGGSINPGSATVSHGSSSSFTVKPGADYELTQVTGCGGSLSDDTYTTGPITANCTVSATFERISYTAVAKFSQGGSLAPTEITKKVGERVEFQVSADEYYHLESIAGCGGELDGSIYVIEALTSNCEVTASFAEDYVQLTGSAAHIIDETNLVVSVDGFSQQDVSLVAHEGDTFTVQLSVRENNVTTEERIRLRVNGRSESGSELQYTATIPSLGELYSGERTYLDTHDIDSLRVTALTTVIDAYATSLLGSDTFSSEQFEGALEVIEIGGINNRLLITEAIYQDNLHGLPTHANDLHHLLSSWSKVNAFMQSLDASSHSNYLNDASIRLKPSPLALEDSELFAFSSTFREPETSAYLSIAGNEISYASASAGWFNPALEFTRESGKLLINLPPMQGPPEAASLWCNVFDTDINSISNPEGTQYQVACENRVSSVWVVLNVDGELVLALENERFIYAQELWTGEEINAQKDYTTSLQRFSSLPADWSTGASQINAQGDDLWVLPSIASSQGTNLFKLNSDNTYKEQILFESELEGFDAYHFGNPSAFSESGVWMLMNGGTNLNLALGSGRYAEIEKVDGDNATLRYLVTFRSDSDNSKSKRVLRLGRVSNFLSPQVFLDKTQGARLLNAINEGPSSLQYPSALSGVFAWSFDEFEGSTVAAVCDSGNFFSDRCDGSFELKEQYTFEVELKENYLLTNRVSARLGDRRVIHKRSFAALKMDNDEILIFEQGLSQFERFFLDSDLFTPLIPGRLVEWQSIDIRH